MAKEEPRRTAAEPRRGSSRPAFEKHWFSDGGLAANLPVHFFDSPLPTRPTFAIDLATFPAGRTRSSRRAGQQLSTSGEPGRPAPAYGGGRRSHWALLSFGVSLVDTARVWVDQAPLTMPGYRDRTVTVYLAADEGGMNLSMPKPGRDGLSESGRSQPAGRSNDSRSRPAKAGPTTVAPVPVGDRRAVRMARRIRSGLPGAAPPSPTRRCWPARRSAVVSGPRREAAARADQGVAHVIADWGAEPADAFTNKWPHPPPALRLTTARRWRRRPVRNRTAGG